ncbi:DUF6338 family protein [Bacterioplanoides sp.]|uniref:DUF6338 family protein n=1 Tax=Bacterioplanoides sp. TaxID=2066072 RepID=UPI003B59C86F
MSDIWEIDKLLIFIAFVIPGFISIKAYELTFPPSAVSASSKIVDAITYSCINYAILLWPIIAIDTAEFQTAHPDLRLFFYTLILFVCPVIWVAIWKKLRYSNWFQENAPHPTSKPWDFVFSQRKEYWMIITLKNGKEIGGKYSGNSFVSSSPAEEQIYIEEVWLLNNKRGFERPVERSSGAIILSSEISTVELIEM